MYTIAQVYASPSRRKMDTKGEGEEMTYPHICFMVDNFDEVNIYKPPFNILEGKYLRIKML